MTRIAKLLLAAVCFVALAFVFAPDDKADAQPGPSRPAGPSIHDGIVHVIMRHHEDTELLVAGPLLMRQAMEHADGGPPPVYTGP